MVTNGPRRSTVVVVNDDATQLRILQGVLESIDLDVLGFESAGQALDTLGTDADFDLIITDLYMPGIDGWRFCRLLRSPEFERYNDRPILLISATYAGAHPQAVAREVGADAFIAAPFDIDAFRHQVVALLEGNRAKTALRALVVEDSPSQATLFRRALEEGGCTVETAGDLAAAQGVLDAVPVDLVILDYHLPDGKGEALLDALRARGEPAPSTVVVTTDPTPELATRLMGKGAHAYLRKPLDPAFLVQTCERVMRERNLLRVEQLLERRTHELRESERRYRMLFEESVYGFALFDLAYGEDGAPEDMRFLDINAAFEELTGVDRDDALGRRIMDVFPEIEPFFTQTYIEVALTGASTRFERTVHPLGRHFEVSAYSPEAGQCAITFADRTAQHRVMEWMRRLNDCMLGFGKEAQRNMDSLLALCCEMLDCTAALYLRRSDGAWETAAQALEPGGAVPAALDEILGVLPSRDDFGGCLVIQPEVEGGMRQVIHFIEPGANPAGALYLLTPHDPDEDEARGQLIGIIAAAVAVEDERLLDARALMASRERYRGIFENLQDVYFESTIDGTILTVSPSLESMTKYRMDDFVGRSYRELYADPGEREALVQRLLAGRRVTDYEIVLLDADGRRMPCSLTAQLLRDEEGRPAHICGTLRDVSPRKQAEAEQRRLEEQIRSAQKLESLGVLAGGIAHDFNNLLMGVMGHAGLALMELDEGTPLHDTIKQIEVAAQRAAELCGQMLAYAGKGTLRITIVDINQVIREMSRLLAATITKRARLHLGLDDHPLPVRGDVTQIRQVVMNLICNASESIQDRSGAITVRTERVPRPSHKKGLILMDNRHDGDYVCLEVADTGCGMDADTRARIFDPFFTTKFAGRGLGLAAVLGIVKGHGGDIELESQPGEGTTFRVYFPLHAEPHRPAAPSPAREIPEPRRAGSAILVVDDERIVREVARRILERQGYRVYLAENGHEALDYMARYHGEIRAVLLDVTMPGMSGEEVLRRLRREHPQVPVVLSSGYSEEDELVNRLQGDAVRFIQKPYGRERLLEIIEHAVATGGR
jgi:PAS domain S-box-containing protein